MLGIREGRELRVRMDEEGFRVVAAADGAPFGADTYDSVHSLLLNTSPAFVAAFNGSLAAALQRAVDEREAGREQHRPGFDYE